MKKLKRISAAIIVILIVSISLYFSVFHKVEIPEKGTINMNTTYGLKSGRILYYDSNTNKHYYDKNFTQEPERISDKLNKAFFENRGKSTEIFLPEGEYLLDKPLILEDGNNLVGVPGKTKIIIDDTFDRAKDDFIISNSLNSQIRISNIHVEYKGFKKPAFSDTEDNQEGIEGIILKIKKSPKAIIENSSFIAKNNGVKAKITPVWVRNGYSNIDIHDCYIENTTAAITGGCLWFMNNRGEIGYAVNVYNNTIVKNGNDEAVAIWGNGGIHRNYNIYNNNINYTLDCHNTSVDNLITIFSEGIGLYKDIKFSNNTFNLTGKVRRIILCSVERSIFSNVLFENNIIKDHKGDASGGELLTTFEVWCNGNIARYKRCDISFNNNSYTNDTKDGRRCLVSAMGALVKLYGNTVKSNFAYAVFFEEAGNSKIISNANDYNYTASETCDFAHISGQSTKAYFTNDKINMVGNSENQSNIFFTDCIFK